MNNKILKISGIVLSLFGLFIFILEYFLPQSLYSLLLYNDPNSIPKLEKIYTAMIGMSFVVIGSLLTFKNKIQHIIPFIVMFLMFTGCWCIKIYGCIPILVGSNIDYKINGYFLMFISFLAGIMVFFVGLLFKSYSENYKIINSKCLLLFFSTIITFTYSFFCYFQLVDSIIGLMADNVMFSITHRYFDYYYHLMIWFMMFGFFSLYGYAVLLRNTKISSSPKAQE